MEWMSSIDSSFLHVENDVTPMHIGGVSLFEGPPPPFEDLKKMVAGKLDLVPRYRQKVRFVPLGAGTPAWVDDPHFSLDYHLRHTAIPAPGSEEQLRNMAARVFSQHLDRNKPLWELWSVEGLADGRWALLSKVHHCMVDGVAATDLMSVMFSDTHRRRLAAAAVLAAAGALRASSCWRARWPTKSAPPVRCRRCSRAAAARPRETLRTVIEAARAAAAASSRMRPVASSSLTGPIGPHRRWAGRDVRLTDVKTVRAALGGTVNDVVLTIITERLPRAARVARRAARPRRRGAHDGARIGAPARRARRLQQPRLGRLRRAARRPRAPTRPARADPRPRWTASRRPSRPSPATCSSSLSGFAPPMLLALGSRLVTASPRLNMHTATTNVPGPQQPVQTLGRRMLESYPFVPVVGSIRIVVAIFSYDGGLYFGVTGDYDGAPDIEMLTARDRRRR